MELQVIVVSPAQKVVTWRSLLMYPGWGSQKAFASEVFDDGESLMSRVWRVKVIVDKREV